MKKLSILLVTMIMILSLTACGGSGNTEPTTEPTIAPTVAVTVAPTTAPPTTVAPTTESTETTEPPTFSASEEIVDETPTTATDPATGETVPMEESTTNANGEKVMSGTVTGLGGITLVIMRGDGQEYEFAYTGASISGELYDGSYVTITYTGDIMGDSLGYASVITVS